MTALESAHRTHMHICIVERDEHLHEQVALAVRAAGHHVASAYNSTAAIHLLGAERFDLLLIGLASSLIGGYSGIPMIRKLYPDLAIVVIAEADSLMQTPSGPAQHTLGADDVLAQPITQAALLSVLERKAKGGLKAH